MYPVWSVYYLPGLYPPPANYRMKRDGLGHRLADEVKVLALHGVLHLAGYDHERSKADERRMLRKQRELMELLGPI